MVNLKTATALGATKLGCRLTVVPPGKKAFPHHVHHVNDELFVILSDEGALRFGGERYAVRSSPGAEPQGPPLCSLAPCIHGVPSERRSLLNLGTFSASWSKDEGEKTAMRRLLAAALPMLLFAAHSHQAASQSASDPTATVRAYCLHTAYREFCKNRDSYEREVQRRVERLIQQSGPADFGHADWQTFRLRQKQMRKGRPAVGFSGPQLGESLHAVPPVPEIGAGQRSEQAPRTRIPGTEGSDLCPPPHYRMNEQDGCQPTGH